MKKTVLAICLILACTVAGAKKKAAAPVTVNADDSRITWIGRTVVEDGTVSYSWSGVTARIRFEGTGLTMKCSDTKNDWFNVWVDKQPVAKEDSRFVVKGGQTVVLAENLGKGVHDVVLQKRTEAEQGTMSVSSFTCDGKFLQAEGLKERKIEFIGDSYTCGFGTEGASREEKFLPETENVNLTYAAILGRYFNADIHTVSHSGRGIIRNYDSGASGDTMVNRYLNSHDSAEGPAWAVSSFVPDVVVIYLGTNDFSCNIQPKLNRWCSEYAKLLREVRGFYGPDVPILCLASKADELMDYYVEQAAERSGVDNVHFAAILKDAHNSDSDLGSSWHPNYRGHRKVASCVIPFISTLTGWDMPFTPIE